MRVSFCLATAINPDSFIRQRLMSLVNKLQYSYRFLDLPRKLVTQQSLELRERNLPEKRTLNSLITMTTLYKSLGVTMNN